MGRATPRGYGIGHYVISDTRYRRIAEFQVGDCDIGGDVHEFLITPRETALVTIFNPVYWDLTPIAGARNASTLNGIVREIEIATGRMLFEWHSLDHIDVEESMAEPPSSPLEQCDYFHLNSIAEDDGDLIISARRTDAIYKLDGRTGAVVWRLNGKRSDFAVEKQAVFALQHGARARRSAFPVGGQCAGFFRVQRRWDHPLQWSLPGRRQLLSRIPPPLVRATRHGAGYGRRAV